MVHQPDDCRICSGRLARSFWLSRIRCAPLSTVSVVSGVRAALSVSDYRMGTEPIWRRGERGVQALADAVYRPR